MKRGLGYRRDEPGKHAPYGVARGAVVYPETNLALVDYAPTVQDQGVLEACVGYALACAAFVKQVTEGKPAILPSGDFIWWNSKKYRGDEAFNIGTFPSLAVQTLGELGMCPDGDFQIGDGDYAKHPSARAYRSAYDARFHVETRDIFAVDEDLRNQLKAAFAELGPVTMGFSVDTSFRDLGPHDVYSGPSGEILGDHYLCALGYTPEGVLVQNSWGPYWGNAGRALLAWDWVLSSAADVIALKHAELPR